MDKRILMATSSISFQYKGKTIYVGVGEKIQLNDSDFIDYLLSPSYPYHSYLHDINNLTLPQPIVVEQPTYLNKDSEEDLKFNISSDVEESEFLIQKPAIKERLNELKKLSASRIQEISVEKGILYTNKKQTIEQIMLEEYPDEYQLSPEN